MQWQVQENAVALLFKEKFFVNINVYQLTRGENTLSDIRPFRALRPQAELAENIAALPYDVMDTEEARAILANNPLSFLRVTKSEADLPQGIDAHSEAVYQRARENIGGYQLNGQMSVDENPYFYVYKQNMGVHEQIGLVAAASVEEYRQGKIKKHELTRPDKEDDRVRHIKYTAAQTGAVFLTYKAVPAIDRIIADIVARTRPVYAFKADDGISHTLYVVDSAEDIAVIRAVFAAVDALYIADGHHRSAAALRVADLCRANNPAHTGEEEYNYFLSVIFPDNMMQILDYNRVVKDLAGLSAEEFLKKTGERFLVEKLPAQGKPPALHDFAMYLAGDWYKLSAKTDSFDGKDPVGALDVSILQNNLLCPVLGIKDPRTDQRIGFVGGIRGLGELKKLVDSGAFAVAFALYPTSMRELMAIADSGEIMPPKSTWFEPKLRDAMAVHLIEEEYCK